MEDSKPEWLDEKFLSTCLQEQSDSAPVTITSYQVKPGVAVGNNYASDILRVKVNYHTGDSSVKKTVSLIIKAPLMNNSFGEIVNNAVGTTEYEFYYTFLTKLKEITTLKVAPKSFTSSVVSTIVLEDLKEFGFSMADRFEQLDFDHCKCYLTKLAKLHASGIALAKKYPELPEKYPSWLTKFITNEQVGKLMMNCVTVGLKCLVKTLSSLNSEGYTDYVESVRKVTEIPLDSMVAGFQQCLSFYKDDFKSFLHGDCWTTNMMFKYDDGAKPIDIRLLDFQAFSYDGVVNDIVSFIWISATNEVLENNLHDLYHIYCGSLNSTLKELGCEEHLTYEQLIKQISNHSFQMLMIVGSFLPLLLNETPLDTAIIFSPRMTEEQYMTYYQGKHFWKKYPYVMNILAREGVFDWINKIFLAMPINTE